MTEVLNELKKEQIEFICKECGITEEELFVMDEDTLYDSVYDVMCDIECAETPNGNEPLSEHCSMASELVTILGNTIPVDESEFDGEYFDGMRVKYIGEDDPEQLLNGKEYDVMERDKRTGWFRITNEAGDDYLFQPEDFEILRDDGGPGSGNWGHEGRPGEVGGSKDGGGSHNRLEDEDGGYTSFSKKKKKYATPHRTSNEELKKAPAGTMLILEGEAWVKGKFGYTNMATGEHHSFFGTTKMVGDKEVSYAIPDSENKNYRKLKGGENNRFSAERKAKASKFTNCNDADEVLREDTGRIWRDCTNAEKDAINSYTGNAYRTYNGILRGTKSYLDSEGNREIISHITDVIDRAELKQDTWLVRGTTISATEKLFGLEPGTLTGRDAKDMIGLTGTDKGFTSCGTASGTGFDDDVKISIYCPSGTKAIYAEPFSRMGRGGGINWDEENEENVDGVSKQSSFSSEFETILQRGTTFQIIGYKSYYSTVELEVQVISQSTD